MHCRPFTLSIALKFLLSMYFSTSSHMLTTVKSFIHKQPCKCLIIVTHKCLKSKLNVCARKSTKSHFIITGVYVD